MSKVLYWRDQLGRCHQYWWWYRRLPIISGVLPTVTYRAQATAEITDGSITGVSVSYNRQNYSKPKAVVSGNAILDVVLDNGRVTGITIVHGGSGYTYTPTIKIVETDLEIYLSSEDIGVPRNVRIVSTMVDLIMVIRL